MGINFKTYILSITLILSFSMNAFAGNWDKLCKRAVAGQNSLYEIYNECIDFCMATEQDLRKLPMKNRVKLCTFFTARTHNERVVRSNTSLDKIDEAITFCQEQKLHKTGGHWLYISRQCKRIVCEYNPTLTRDAHPECKVLNEGINNGRTEWLITPHKYEDTRDTRQPVPETIDPNAPAIKDGTSAIQNTAPADGAANNSEPKEK